MLELAPHIQRLATYAILGLAGLWLLLHLRRMTKRSGCASCKLAPPAQTPPPERVSLPVIDS